MRILGTEFWPCEASAVAVAPKCGRQADGCTCRSKAMGGLRTPLGQRRHRQAKKWGGHQQEGKGKGKASW